jgi:N4-gp56 family major capsid protein
MAYTWTFDVPTGVFKNHQMSRKLYMKALADSHFMDYVRSVEGFGRKHGETITLTRVGTIAEPSSAVLQEGQRIPEDQFALSTVAVGIQEIGRAVPYTNLVEDLSEFDIENPIQSRLMDQKRLVLDTMAATAFKTAKVTYAPTGPAAATIETTGTCTTTALANWSLYHVEEIRDYLHDTLLATPWDGNNYMAIVRTLGLRGIRRDPAWEQWQVYANPEAKQNFEVGRLENIRFVETNHSNALGKVGSGSVLGEGIVFGKDSVVMAEVQTPELRAEPKSDFGRSGAVAWYGNLGFGLVWDTANAGEARVVRVTSA